MDLPTELNDRTIVDYLRRHAAATVLDLVDFTGVTATAVRQRLTRLMEQGLVAREAESAGRGRPTHRYSLTPAGIRSGGNNYGPLVQVLWDEIRDFIILHYWLNRRSEPYWRDARSVPLPTSFEDLIALVALYRPGPLEQIPLYIQNKNNPSQIRYLHPILKPILDHKLKDFVY